MVVIRYYCPSGCLPGSIASVYLSANDTVVIYTRDWASVMSLPAGVTVITLPTYGTGFVEVMDRASFCSMVSSLASPQATQFPGMTFTVTVPSAWLGVCSSG